MRSWKENSIKVLSIILNNNEYFHYISLSSFFSQILLCFFILLPELSLHFFLLLSFLALLLCLLYLTDRAEILCDWISFCHHFFAGEESREFSNAMLRWKQQGPWRLKLGSTFKSCSLKLPRPVGPMGQEGGRFAQGRCIKADTLVICEFVGEGWWQRALLWKQGEVCMLSDPSVAMIQIQSKTSELITT